MKVQLFAIIYGFLIVTTYLASGAELKCYNIRMFTMALSETGTSPLYVLISIRGTDSVFHEVCTLAPFVLGALHTEYNIPYDVAAERKAKRLATDAKDRKFTFTHSKAIANVLPRYSANQLREVSPVLMKYSRQELIAQLHKQGSPLQQLYIHRQGKRGIAYRDAIACVLLRRGVSVGVADRTGSLFAP